MHDRETELSLGQILRKTLVVLVLRRGSASASPSTASANVSCRACPREPIADTDTCSPIAVAQSRCVSPAARRGFAQSKARPTHLVRVQVHVIIPDLEEHGDEVDEGDVVAAA